MVEEQVLVMPLGPEHTEGLVALFRDAQSPCFCRFWHFAGTNNDWLDRCANAPIENEKELRAAIANGSPTGQGVIALLGQKVIGWMKIAPVTSMKKAYDRRLYKNLPCFEGDRTGVFAIGCFLVHPNHRHVGVSTTLVAGSIEWVKARGGRALEAFPRRPKEAVRDDELWTGPMGAFAKNGFVEVNSFEPYPVLRLDF